MLRTGLVFSRRASGLCVSRRWESTDITSKAHLYPDLHLDASNLISRQEVLLMNPRDLLKLQTEAYDRYLKNPDLNEILGPITYQDRIDYFADPQRDPIQHAHNLAKFWVYQKLGITPEKRAEFDAKFHISNGADSLEWCLGSPPTPHTFDELPIIKIDE
eukprot:TRINITY_DN277_c0_g2_i3.p1 TRINITY_DN277_c0_g2~~TRINITY_DN277_c0_g2_i3.p1  ORF type:complete len:160 (-),score=50.40 TRINITY_DN277_c0_g2_i3:94-573(-)